VPAALMARGALASLPDGSPCIEVPDASGELLWACRRCRGLGSEALLLHQDFDARLKQGAQLHFPRVVVEGSPERQTVDAVAQDDHGQIVP
jgi:hypothetical protein